MQIVNHLGRSPRPSPGGRKRGESKGLVDEDSSVKTIRHSARDGKFTPGREFERSTTQVESHFSVGEVDPLAGMRVLVFIEGLLDAENGSGGLARSLTLCANEADLAIDEDLPPKGFYQASRRFDIDAYGDDGRCVCDSCDGHFSIVRQAAHRTGWPQRNPIRSGWNDGVYNSNLCERVPGSRTSDGEFVPSSLDCGIDGDLFIGVQVGSGLAHITPGEPTRCWQEGNQISLFQIDGHPVSFHSVAHRDVGVMQRRGVESRGPLPVVLQTVSHRGRIALAYVRIISSNPHVQ
jgi:hypothetical protein